MQGVLSRLSDERVRQHMLGPLAYRAGRDRFRSDFVASALQAERREVLLSELVEAFADQAIPLILLKGISYIGTIYDDPGERPMSDIDVLVRGPDHGRALGCLRRLGYWDAGSRMSAFSSHHAVAMKRRHASIDLHRNIVQPLRSRVDVRGLWQRAAPAVERSDGALRLDPVDELVVHLIHIARHELMVPLINYVDGARLLERVPGGRSAVVARAERFRAGRAVGAALAMTDAMWSERSFPSRLLPDVDEVVRGRAVWRPLQMLRKASLVDGPRELVGLVAVGLYERFSPTRRS
jgi:hypothetical protein